MLKIPSKFLTKQDACRRCVYASHKFTPPSGSPDADVMWVGGFPWSEGEEKKTVFGVNGERRFKQTLSLARMNPNDQYTTLACKCQPSNPKKGVDKRAMDMCNRLFLRKEIQWLRPRVIVPMGNDALKAVDLRSGIKKVRGVVNKHTYRTYTCKVIPTFAPTYVNRNPGLQLLVTSDFKLIAWQSTAKKILKRKNATYRALTSKEETLKYFTRLKKATCIAIDTETTSLDDRDAEILCISMSDTPFEGVVLNLYGDFPKKISWAWDKEIIRELYYVLTSGVKIYMHNMKFDLRKLRMLFKRVLFLSLSWNSKAWKKMNVQDTILHHNLLDENLPKNLKDLCRLYTDIIYTKKELDAVKSGTLTQCPVEHRTQYAGKDADGTLRLGPDFEQRIHDEKFWKLYATADYSELKTCWTLLRMELFGIPINRKKMKRLRKQVRLKLKKFRSRLHHLAGHEFNPNSPPQLRKVMFDELHLPCNRELRTGKTELIKTDKHQIEWMIENTNHSFPRVYRIWKQYKTMLGNFVKSLISYTYFESPKDKIGWLHSDFILYGPPTGRVVSHEPNVVNIPRDKEFEKGVLISVRDMIEAPAGWYVLDTDYCVVPESKVLCANLKWKRADELNVGDDLVGFDENLLLGQQNKFKPSRVERVTKLRQPCYKVITDKGEFIASELHGWVSRKVSSGGSRYIRKWVKTKDLKCGDLISFISKPWKTDISSQARYLAGFFDGEGWVNKAEIGWAQNPGRTANRVECWLINRGFIFEGTSFTNPKSECVQHRMGGYENCLKFLGNIRPYRLLEKSKMLWDGKRTWGRTTSPATILSVNYVGERDVIGFQTTTKTCIINGFLSHNSQIEFKIAALESGDTELIRLLFDEHEDIHRVAGETCYADRWATCAAKIKRLMKLTEGHQFDNEKHRKVCLRCRLRQSQEVLMGEMRRNAKAYDFGKLFGGTEKNLAARLGIAIEDAYRFSERMDKRFPLLGKYIKLMPVLAWKEGVLESPFGRLRRFPHTWDEQTRASQGRQAINHGPQTGNAYITRGSLNRIAENCLEAKTEGFPIDVIYDSILVLAPRDEVVWMAEMMQKEMMKPVHQYEDRVFDIAQGVGRTWKIAEDRSKKIHEFHKVVPVMEHGYTEFVLQPIHNGGK